MVVRMRINRSATRKRRSHHGLTAPDMAVCKNCGANHRPHHMCLECGFYNGRQVLNLTAEKEKREARLKAKKEAISGAQAPEAAEAPEAKLEAPKETKQAKKKTAEKTEEEKS